METNLKTKGICAGFLMPHPPIILHEVGKGRENDASATVNACKRAAACVADLAPDTIVVISPHSPLFSDFLFIHDSPTLSGTFETFGVQSLRMEFKQDTAYRTAFTDLLQKAGIPAGTIDISQIKRYGLSEDLDHGVLVPLRFISEVCAPFNIVALSSSAFELETLTRCGAFLADAAIAAGRRVCVVASGDMSHRVSAASPYGKTEEGAKFDRKICKAIDSSDMDAIRAIDHGLRDKAGECGYHSLVMMIAAMDRARALASGEIPAGSGVQSHLFSYEAPFGIGYCVAEFLNGSGGEP